MSGFGVQHPESNIQILHHACAIFGSCLFWPALGTQCRECFGKKSMVSFRHFHQQLASNATAKLSYRCRQGIPAGVAYVLSANSLAQIACTSTVSLAQEIMLSDAKRVTLHARNTLSAVLLAGLLACASDIPGLAGAAGRQTSPSPADTSVIINLYGLQQQA